MKPGWATMTRAERIAGIEAGKLVGKSASEIAADLSAPSRSAVLGFVYRHMVLDKDRAKRWDKRPLQARPPAPVVIRKAVKKDVVPPARVARVVKAAPKMLEAVVVNPRPMIDRRMGFECAWLVGDPREPDPQCCGAPTELGASWCQAHRQIVYGRAA